MKFGIFDYVDQRRVEAFDVADEELAARHGILNDIDLVIAEKPTGARTSP